MFWCVLFFDPRYVLLAEGTVWPTANCTVSDCNMTCPGRETLKYYAINGCISLWGKTRFWNHKQSREILNSCSSTSVLRQETQTDTSALWVGKHSPNRICSRLCCYVLHSSLCYISVHFRGTHCCEFDLHSRNETLNQVYYSHFLYSLLHKSPCKHLQVSIGLHDGMFYRGVRNNDDKKCLHPLWWSHNISSVYGSKVAKNCGKFL
jgi:hypothetical protein